MPHPALQLEAEEVALVDLEPELLLLLCRVLRIL
jgi:hypothetical protein